MTTAIAGFRTAIALARDWDCRFADAGAVGHINAQSGLGDWDFGELLLKQLLREHRLSHRDEDVMPPPQPQAFVAPRSAALQAAA